MDSVQVCTSGQSMYRFVLVDSVQVCTSGQSMYRFVLVDRACTGLY